MHKSFISLGGSRNELAQLVDLHALIHVCQPLLCAGTDFSGRNVHLGFQFRTGLRLNRKLAGQGKIRGVQATHVLPSVVRIGLVRASHTSVLEPLESWCKIEAKRIFWVSD